VQNFDDKTCLITPLLKSRRMYEDNIKKNFRKMFYPDAGLTEKFWNSVPQQALKLAGLNF
jgi:hypothetical protein